MLAALLSGILAASSPDQMPNECPGHRVTIDPDGSIVSGSKAALIAAVQNGEPIRVGWALDADGDKVVDLVHWADATFLTIFEGEVFAQVAQIHGQGGVRGKAKVTLTEQQIMWWGSLGTNGQLQGRVAGQPLTEMPVKSWWCSQSCL